MNGDGYKRNSGRTVGSLGTEVTVTKTVDLISTGFDAAIARLDRTLKDAALRVGVNFSDSLAGM